MNRGSRKGGATPKTKHTPSSPHRSKPRKGTKPTRQHNITSASATLHHTSTAGIMTKASTQPLPIALVPSPSIPTTTSIASQSVAHKAIKSTNTSPITQQQCKIATTTPTMKSQVSKIKKIFAPTATTTTHQPNPLTQQFRSLTTTHNITKLYNERTQQNFLHFGLQCTTVKAKRLISSQTSCSKRLKTTNTSPSHTTPIRLTAQHSHSLLFTPRARFSTAAGDNKDKVAEPTTTSPSVLDQTASGSASNVENSPNPEVVITAIKPASGNDNNTTTPNLAIDSFAAPRVHKMTIKVPKAQSDNNDGDNSQDKVNENLNQETKSLSSASALIPIDNALSTGNMAEVGSALNIKGDSGEEQLTKFEKFLERNPAFAAWYRFSRKLSKITLAFGAFLGLVALLSTQVSSYPVLVQPAKELLQGESAAVLAGALEEMAALGLIDLKLIPTSVVEAMADPSNRQFGKDPHLKIEKPELGYFIGSAEAFKDRVLPSSNALPRYHDSFLIEADPNETYVMREAVRNQHIELTKGLFEVENQAVANMKVKLQLLPGILGAYTQLYVQYPEFVHIVAQFKQTPLYAIERVIDVLYLRGNQTPDAIRSITQDMSEESLQRLTSGSGDRESFNLGAKLQHYLMNDTTETGRMLKKIDDKFISSFRSPADIDQQLLADHPFREELSNIPADILSHPDRSLTGPLFQTYYNILGRNQYFNLLVEENTMMTDLRAQLIPVAETFGLISPGRPITGMNDADLDLNDQMLKPYLDFNQKQITTRLNQTSIESRTPNPMTLNQTPLMNQPFHYFKSTGVPITEAQFDVMRKFEDILPMSDRLVNQQKVTSVVRDSSALERYLVEPINITKANEYHIDTSSLTRRHREDVVNREWAEFDALPPRWIPDQRFGTNPQIPDEEVDAMQRLLTKLDVAILRNQSEMVRIHKVAMEQNPIFGAQHQKLLDLEDEKNAKINELFENMMKAEEDARKAAQGQNEEEAQAPWYKFW